MPGQPLGRVIDIDAYFEALESQQLHDDEVGVEEGALTVKLGEKLPIKAPVLAPDRPRPEYARVWPREGGLSIETMQSFHADRIILLDYMDNSTGGEALDGFIRKYESLLNFRSLKFPSSSPKMIVSTLVYKLAIGQFAEDGYAAASKPDLMAPDTSFTLTPKGRELLDYHGHLLFFWKAYNAPYKMEEVHGHRALFPQASAKDVTLSALQYILDHGMIPDVSKWEFAYRSVLLASAHCCVFFGDIPGSLIYWTLVCYIDINEPVITAYDARKEDSPDRPDRPSAAYLKGEVLSGLEQCIGGDAAVLDPIRADFIKEAEGIGVKSARPLLSPAEAWDILHKTLIARSTSQAWPPGPA